MKSKAALTVLVSALFGLLPTIEAASFTFTPINLPQGISADVEGINDSGQIVGSFLDGIHGYQGFLLDHGTFSIIDAPGSGTTQISAINNAGQIVGTSGVNGFLYRGGQFVTLNVPGAFVTMPMDINNSGTIVGNYFASDGAGYYTVFGFVYSNGTFTSVGSLPCAAGINDSGQILECNGILSPSGAFAPLSVSGSTAFKRGFNNLSSVVGSFVESGAMARGFLDNDGTFTVVDAPNAVFPYGTYSVPDINNLGEIVANVYLGPGGVRPFLGTPLETPEPASFLLVWAGLICGGLLPRIKASRPGGLLASEVKDLPLDTR